MHLVYQVRGLSLHDLRFRGQRIVYELATQEMYVSYNGYGGSSGSRCVRVCKANTYGDDLDGTRGGDC